MVGGRDGRNQERREAVGSAGRKERGQAEMAWGKWGEFFFQQVFLAPPPHLFQVKQNWLGLNVNRSTYDGFLLKLFLL